VVAVAARNLWVSLTSTEAFGGQGAATGADEDSGVRGGEYSPTEESEENEEELDW